MEESRLQTVTWEVSFSYHSKRFPPSALLPIQDSSRHPQTTSLRQQALSTLGWWKMSLLIAGGLEPDDLEIFKTPPGRSPVQPALGDPASAGGLD